MDQSYSESDISMSPTQILERLQMLQQFQLMQRGKLQKQSLQYQENSENSSCITEMISHFTNSVNTTSYNTFQSLLQSSQNVTEDASPRLNTSDMSQKLQKKDLIEGVSVLNLSQESELIVKTPVSSRSGTSINSKFHQECNGNTTPNTETNKFKNKQISLDEMPILSPKKDFESLVLEKMHTDKNDVKTKSTIKSNAVVNKKPFLRRGEGMARFGLRKNDLVIQNTKSLPWKKNTQNSQPYQSPLKISKLKNMESNNSNQRKTSSGNNFIENTNNNNKNNNQNENLNIDIIVPPLKLNVKRKSVSKVNEKDILSPNVSENTISSATTGKIPISQEYDTSNCSIHSENKMPDKILQMPTGKHPMLAKKGKTWASVLSTEQSDFLMQLKQSEYYKNFASPAKSIVSDMSSDGNTSKLRQEKESAEQNLFDLLESKVSHESFNLENSFFNRLLRRSNLECSGESTPTIMQMCLANNPNLLHIFPEAHQRKKHDLYNDADTCQSEYTDCTSDTCSSVSSCCSCKTIEPATPETCKKDKNIRKEVQIETKQNDKKCQDEVDKEHEVMKANMVEMNAKLITTSELLKDRLRELEDEIETFRKENMNLNKLKEEVEIERHKFYEEKGTFEQKFNEEKILSEYYLAEEKEKLNKQKQMYDRYVREIRGRLSKKEKDEVVNLRQEITNLKEEIRIKDAKSTSTIARLRNQLKIMEKEKTELQNEVEKLKKENRRIQHSNDITRRLTNMKYLEQINKKLSNMNKESQSEVELNSDVKYKAFEIERQSRSRKAQPVNKGTIKPRAKSVPNLKVTSRYAKYFSQRDAISHRDGNFTVNDTGSNALCCDSDDEDRISIEKECSDDNELATDDISTYNDNNLEKIYMETFRPTSPKIRMETLRSTSPKSNRSSKSNSKNNYLTEHNSASSTNGFFLRKSNSSSSRDSKSPVNTSPYERGSINRSKSPVSSLNHRANQQPSINLQESANLSGESNHSHRSKSPVSISNHSSQRLATVIHKDIYRDKLMTVSPEPSSSKISLTKTNLNPTEIRKQDGSKELRFPNGNIKYISADGKYCKFLYYNGDVKENFYSEGRIKYYYAESKTCHTTHVDGLEVLEFPDGQVEKRYKDGSSEIRLPNGSVRYHDPKNEHIREEWRFPDGSALTVSANGERRIVFGNGQVEVHSNDHKRREFPDGTVKLVYNDGTSETRYASGRVRIKDKHGNLIMDSAPG